MFIELFFTLFKLVGLAPMSLLSQSSEKCQKKLQRFEFSYLGTFYNLFLAAAIAAVHSYFAYSTHSDGTKVKKTMVSAMGMVYIFATFIIIFLTILNFAWNQRSFVKFLNELYRVHLSLLNFDENYLVKQIKTKYTLIMIIENGSMVGISVYMLLNEELYSTIFILVNTMILNWLISQYLLVIYILQAMVKCINRNFEMTNEKFLTEQIFLMVGLKSSKVSPNSFDSMIKTSRILVLRDVCLKYYDTTFEISDFYSLAMLGCVAKSFGSIVIDAYLLLDPVMRGRMMVESFDDLMALSWMFYDFFSIAVITFSVTSTQKEVRI